MDFRQNVQALRGGRFNIVHHKIAFQSPKFTTVIESQADFFSDSHIASAKFSHIFFEFPRGKMRNKNH